MNEREKSISEIISKVQSLPLGSIHYPSLWSWLCEVVGVENRQLPDLQTSSLEMTSKGRESQTEVREEESVEKMDIDVTSDAQTSSFTKFDAQYQSLMSSSVLKTIVVEQRPIALSMISDIQKEHTREDMEAILTKPPSAKDTGATTQPAVASGSSDCDAQPSSDVTHELLLVKCLYGVSVCAVRCPAYFKPLYRIAKALLSLGLPEVKQLPHLFIQKVDYFPPFVQLARDIVLGPLPVVLGELQDKLLPLFVLKANIFSVSLNST